jgi:hypothetical protein
MSTKTTFKRVALVAVAALGLGMLSTVPASAAALSSTTNYTTDIAFAAASVPVAGNAGDAVDTTVLFKTSTTAEVHQQPDVMLISSPSTSSMASVAYNAAVTKGKYSFSTGALTNSNNTASGAEGNTDLTTATTDVDADGYAYNRSSTGTKYTYETLHFNAWYDVAGTYKWVFFNDVDDSGTINGSEYSEVYTVVAADGTAAITGTVAAHNATSGAASTYGSLVKISLKDAAGNAASPDSAGGVKVTVSGSAVVAYSGASYSSAATSQTLILGREDFNGSGAAWINVTDATAEVVTVTLSGVGSTTITANVPSLTFTTATGSTSGQVAAGATTPNIGTIAANAANLKLGATAYLKTAATAVAVGATAPKDDVNVTDTFGTITGKAAARYSLAVAAGDTDATHSGAFSIAAATVVAEQTFSVDINGGTAVVFTSKAQSATSGAVKVLTAGATSYSATASLTSAKLAAITVTVKAYDQFSGAYANVTITPSLSSTSRNYGQSFSTIVTGSAGTATFTLTDANTAAGTSLTDVVSFSDGTNTGTLTITYATDANMDISTMVIDSNDTDSTGVTLASVTPVAINTGDGADGTTSATTVTLKNSAGTLLNGVPVVWSISGTGAALSLPTGMTSYSSAGVATASAYAWIAGTYTVTATVGTKTVSAPITFASTTRENARVVSATANGATVTAKAVDRFGNPVKNVAFTAKTTGGYFGSGSTSATGTTDSTGTVDFVLLGGSGDVTVSLDKSVYTQTTAVKDSSTADAADTYSATVAATATAAAYYIGGSYAPAGVNSATVNVTGADTLAQAATDAAAEATDAANAATDAANAAAEAADAATAAAQDAADAVAALSAQVSTMMASLKAQLTALTNLVIKIQKKVKA